MLKNQVHEPQSNTNIYDLQLWKKFWQLSKMYWFSEEKWKARGILAILMILLCAFSSINILFSYLNRDLMTALQEKNLQTFYHSLFLFAGGFIVATPITALFGYVQQKMAINWRLWLTTHFLNKYFQNRAFYHISNAPDIDNPDQRIAEDVNSLTHNNLALLLIFFNSLVQFFAFAGILWSISTKLVVILVFYAAFGTIVSILLGKRLLHLNFEQIHKNANLRYGLMHVRDNAESIAFYQGEEREKNQVLERLKAAISNNLVLVAWERNLSFFTTGYNYIPLILPFVVLAPQYFAGEITMGVLTQAVGAFASVLSALAVIATNFATFSSIAAGAARLEAFATHLEQPLEPAQLSDNTILTREDTRLALDMVTLLTPDRQQSLLKEVTAEVVPGSGLLIAGSSGVGKSSLLRALAGLWNAGGGLIVRPQLHDMFFLPQRPYMILGSLREQLLYPNLQIETTDDELQAVLEMVNLPHLAVRVGGLDSILEWGSLLSLGEQQRLAFARLLLAKPRYVVLDEATSALDVQNEAMLYGLLKQSLTTFVSVGHRPSLLAYHDNVLELQGGGNWRLVPVEGFELTATR